MGEKGEPAIAARGVNQDLRVDGMLGQLGLGAKHQQMILLRLAPGVVHLFAHQDQDLAIFVLVVTLRALDPDVVV